MTEIHYTRLHRELLFSWLTASFGLYLNSKRMNGISWWISTTLNAMVLAIKVPLYISIKTTGSIQPTVDKYVAIIDLISIFCPLTLLIAFWLQFAFISNGIQYTFT